MQNQSNKYRTSINLPGVTFWYIISSKIFAQLEINRAPIDASASVPSGSELTRDRQRMKEKVLLMKLQGS